MKETRLMVRRILLLAFTIVIIGLNCEGVLAFEDIKTINEFREGLQEPIDAAISENGNVYVLDQQLSKVIVFTAEGRSLNSFSERGSQAGQLLHPQAIAVGNNGDVLVADTGNKNVQAFSAKGEFLYSLKYYGNYAGDFKHPDSLAIDKSGNIFVGDSETKTITKFSAAGEYLEHRKLDFKPTDLAFDVEDKLYILMPSIGRIVKFDLQTKKYELITFKLDGKNLIAQTKGFSVDDAGLIYLIESDTHSIKKIDQNKNLLFSYGSQGAANGEFNWPSAVTLDHSGRIYVADARNSRIQVLGNEETLLANKKQEAPVSFSADLEDEADTLEKIVITRISKPLSMINTPDKIIYTIAKKMIIEEVSREFAFRLGIKKDALSAYINIEAEERLINGQIKLTLSIPKEIPLETSTILSRM